MHVIAENYGLRSPGRFEIYWKQWSLAAELIYTGSDEDSWPWMLHLHFLLFSIYLRLPLKSVPASSREPWMREWQRWGFSHCDDAVHFHWNERTSVVWLPWFHKIHQRTQVRRADGTWATYVGSWEQGKEPDGRELFTFLYTYHPKNRTIQNRTATVFVERMAWRPKWFTWTRLFEKSRQTISIEFNDEVGERSGSWKGGCVGCSYEMRPGETAEQTLRRMERERVFN